MAVRLCAQGLCVRFGQRQVLRAVSAAFAPGAVTGILGPNGSGKTTLLRALCGAVAPQAGQALVDGQPVASLPSRLRAQRLAVVPQAAALDFAFTVGEVVGMGRLPYQKRFGGESAADARLTRAALADTGIAALADRNAQTLSGGEWQRVLIARALAQDTPILLLDEPVSALDVAHQIEIMELIARLAARGRTVVCVLHDLNLAIHYCQHVLLMKAGGLLAQGPPGRALDAQNLQAAYGVDMARLTHPRTGETVLAPQYPAAQASTR